MDPAVLTNVLVSGSVAGLIGLALYLMPVRPPIRPVSTSVESQLRDIQARYEEMRNENARLRDEYQAKLIEYTNAIRDWNQREAGHLERIKLLEARVKALQERIHQLEERSGVVPASPVPAKYVVVAIWPDPSLDTDGEADAIYNAGYDYRPLRNEQARRSAIIREINRVQADERLIVEIGAHGTDEGTILHAGDIAKPGWWRRVLSRRPNIEMVTLLSCESTSISQALTAQGIPAVISMSDAIADDDAVVFVQELYGHLAQHGDIEAAVDYARLHVSHAAWEMIRLDFAKNRE